VTEADAESSLMGTNAKMMTIPPDLLDLYTPPTGREIEDTLTRVTDQLHSRHDNAVIFALQNVHSITTLDQYSSETAVLVSKYIIGNYNCIRDIIAAVFTGHIGNMKDSENSETICNLSLSILINCMQALSSKRKNNNDDAGNSIDDYESRYFIEMLIPSLGVAVANYNKHAHTACLAMKCLCFMATSSSLARTTIEGTNIRSAVEGAKVYGSIEHLRLEQEANDTMRTLQSQLITVA